MIKQFKYKAFISYSHTDSRWASWLHRALESYRLPRKLVGTSSDAGKVPARIRPVFRDRDDLSSASDLGGTVKQALSDSENLIVVCSPDAAASFWVNEEIRQFASLGREKQIFCVIVDGEPSGIDTPSTCFPAALAEIGLQEPLAADVRKWADGKHLSKLKLVSGILGLPLDQLRRRDLQKRQKTWALAAIASIAIAAVLITAVTARISAQQRRDSGESLVSYKLNELRTLLNVTGDPENLDRLDQWSLEELDGYRENASVGDKTLLKSALELRDEGIDFWQVGDLTPAMQKFQQSWALFAMSYRDDRNNHLTFFELGQAEYWIGQTYMDQGDLDATEEAYMSYAEITRRLILLQHENAEWVLEMAYALTGLGALQESRDADNPERVLQFMQSSLEYNQIALVLDPTNEYYRSELGPSHAFLGDAQLKVCDLEGALKSRQEHVNLERKLLNTEPENPARVQRMAIALIGFALVKEYQGQSVEAIESLEKAKKLLESNLSRDVNLRDTTILVLDPLRRIASLRAFEGKTDEALKISNSLSEKWLELEGIGQEDIRTAMFYTAYLLDHTWLGRVHGDTKMTNQMLTDIQLHLATAKNNLSFKRKTENMLMLAAFRYWEMNNELPPANILAQLPVYTPGSGRARACKDASMAVNKSVMLGKTAQAQAFTDYLLNKNFREAGFMSTCKKYSLCDGQ